MDGSGAITRRFVRGDGADELIAEYPGAGTSDIRYHHLDERGSTIAWSDGTGAMASISKYDEYGVPAATNPGRFQYTGQMWLPELGVYHYKARAYSPQLGRFLQTDPVGYDGGINLYAYVGNDPVNFTDPMGLQEGEIDGECPQDQSKCPRDIIVIGGFPNTAPDVNAANSALLTTGYSREPLYTLQQLEEMPIFVTASKPKRRTRPPLVETPSLDLFTFWKHFRHDQGETICLTESQFERVVQLGKPVGRMNRNGANLVSYYGTPLEYTFGTATLLFRRDRAVGFRDIYDFNIGGASRSTKGQALTILGNVAGSGARPFETRYPC